MTKVERIEELVNKYNEWDKKDDGSINPLACIARDNKRSIRKRFEKEMHDDERKRVYICWWL